MRLIPIAGFCGAGKSLELLRLALELKAKGQNVCICLQRENPITSALVGEYEVKIFNQLETISGYDSVIYECNGLQAGMKAELSNLAGYEMTPMTVVVDPAKLHVMASYGAPVLGNAVYNDVIHAQLKQADVVLLSHVDLQQPSEAVRAMAAADAPGAEIIDFSAKVGDGADTWIQALEKAPAPAQDVAPIQAEMARYDCSLHIAAPMGFFPDKFLNAMAHKSREALSALPVPLSNFQFCTVSDEGVAITGCTDIGGIIRNDRSVELCSIGHELHIQLGGNCDREYLCDVMYDVIQHTCTSMEQGMTVVGEYPSIWDDED